MNGIFEKLHRSWQLFKRSVLVIRDHPKLLLFPIVTSVLTGVIALFFLAPVGLLLLAPHFLHAGFPRTMAESFGMLQFRTGGNPSFNFAIQPIGAAILAGIYLVDMFLATLGSVAFNSQILEALGGRPVSIRNGVMVACSRWKSVLLWSLLAGTVGLVIRAIEERLDFVGRLIAGFIGLAWSVAAVFAIPILVREPATANPLKVLSTSAGLIKRTWGEMLAGYVGLEGSHLLWLWASILGWVASGLLAFFFSNAWILLPAGIIWLLGTITYGYLASVASRVYLCALYLYATEGFVPGHYDAGMMELAWKPKQG